MSPLEYINKVRIQTACEILKKTDESIADIAYKCGFTTNSTFKPELPPADGNVAGRVAETPGKLRAAALEI